MSDHHLVPLDADHPGFRDPLYRQRRDELARIAIGHAEGEPVPRVAYTEDEHRVWRAVWAELTPLHTRWVHPALNALQRDLELAARPIPQLADVNDALAATGFRMEPVAGLVTPRDFLEALGRGIFLSTQYMRHSSRPLYTPEPDVIHELVGHAASLFHPAIAELSMAFGRLTAISDDRAVEAIVRVYWWTLEFGLALHEGAPKAVGAGLLSSAGELAGSGAVPHQPWDLDRMASTPYDPTCPNPQLFVAPSLEAMIADTTTWLERRRHHRAA